MSSIRPKKKVCTTCQKFTYIFSRSRCKFCANIEDSKSRIEKQIAQEKEEEKKHKANPSKPKELVFQKTKKKPGFFEMPEDEVNNEINYQPAPEEGFDGKATSAFLMDEIGVWASPLNSGIWTMDKFWTHAEKVIAKTERCWNCGEWIAPQYYRAATGHIFPKAIFESIASNEWNFVVVGAGCGCHSDTHTLEKFSKMPVFGTAVNRFRKFEHLITETHKYLSLFREYAEAHELKNK